MFPLIGARDGTLRVWNIERGVLVTLFDLHAPVLECLMSPDAARLMVRLEDSAQVPRLCLHNSPAVTTQPSVADLHIPGGEWKVLSLFSWL